MIRLALCGLLFAALAPAVARATITQIIDSTGDGAGHVLDGPYGVALDSAGNVYVTGTLSDNAFRITPAGAVSEIIDATGDGGGNILDGPRGVGVDSDGNVYVAGELSDNVFQITPGGAITEIIDATGDGEGNPLDGAYGVGVDPPLDYVVYVTGVWSNNAFKINRYDGEITEIIDATGDGLGNPLEEPRSIAAKGIYIYVSGAASENVFRIHFGGIGVIYEIIDASGDGSSPLSEPWGVAFDGALYVAGRQSQNTFRRSFSGPSIEIIDATGDGLGNTLGSPYGVAALSASQPVPAKGYVSGATSNNVFEIESTGTITEIIDALGDGVGHPLAQPAGVAVAPSGRVYVAGFASDNAFEILPDPFCGNRIQEAGEECDVRLGHGDDDLCPGLCTDTCTCLPPICGNDVREGAEACDGVDDFLCPGECSACACPSTTCGDDVREGAEVCDGLDDALCPGLCLDVCTCPGQPIPAMGSDGPRLLLILALFVIPAGMLVTLARHTKARKGQGPVE